MIVVKVLLIFFLSRTAPPLLVVRRSKKKKIVCLSLQISGGFHDYPASGVISNIYREISNTSLVIIQYAFLSVLKNVNYKRLKGKNGIMNILQGNMSCKMLKRVLTYVLVCKTLKLLHIKIENFLR